MNLKFYFSFALLSGLLFSSGTSYAQTTIPRNTLEFTLDETSEYSPIFIQREEVEQRVEGETPPAETPQVPDIRDLVYRMYNNSRQNSDITNLLWLERNELVVTMSDIQNAQRHKKN